MCAFYIVLSYIGHVCAGSDKGIFMQVYILFGAYLPHNSLFSPRPCPLSLVPFTPQAVLLGFHVLCVHGFGDLCEIWDPQKRESVQCAFLMCKYPCDVLTWSGV